MEIKSMFYDRNIHVPCAWCHSVVKGETIVENPDEPDAMLRNAMQISIVPPLKLSGS
jgi:hypothetical protein